MSNNGFDLLGEGGGWGILTVVVVSERGNDWDGVLVVGGEGRVFYLTTVVRSGYRQNGEIV